MKRISLARLEAKIIRPGIEEHLKPLLRYRGSQALGRIHRLWNLMLSAMEHEATVADITQRLSKGQEYSKLCGPPRGVEAVNVYSFAGRLLDNPSVMANAPHLEEYLRWAIPSYRRFRLTKLDDPPEGFVTAVRGKCIAWAAHEYGVDYRHARRWFEECGVTPVHAGRIPLPKNWHSLAPKENNVELARRFGISPVTVARWRSETGVICLAPRKYVVPYGSIVYPFVIHDGGKPEHDLLRKVNAAVPKHFDPETRADICQDLVVGILCGDFSEDDLGLPAKEMTRRVMQMFPTKYGPLSLDAEIAGTDGFTLMDTLSDEDGLWERV
jgi:hypothetical protein